MVMYGGGGAWLRKYTGQFDSIQHVAKEENKFIDLCIFFVGTFLSIVPDNERENEGIKKSMFW